MASRDLAGCPLTDRKDDQPMPPPSSEISLTTIQKKVCLLGEFAVGKTSLVRRFVEGRFDDRYLSTIGVKISRKSVELPHGRINLLLWDLAGSDEFNGQIRANYLRGAAGALIVCDLTRPETLTGFHRYVEQIQTVGLSIPVVFVGNKVDLTDLRAISDDQLQAAAQQFGGQAFLTSAKTGHNVEDIFYRLAVQLHQRD
ncbi:MAG: GTP-binding protein [Anaerolineales bacterium]|nr:GTP-binding protein [Anaerolineales bacterium]MDW8277118.1 Rab family GTPase [Anaerolineales bacterium]